MATKVANSTDSLQSLLSHYGNYFYESHADLKLKYLVQSGNSAYSEGSKIDSIGWAISSMSITLTKHIVPYVAVRSPTYCKLMMGTFMLSNFKVIRKAPEY